MWCFLFAVRILLIVVSCVLFVRLLVSLFAVVNVLFGVSLFVRCALRVVCWLLLVVRCVLAVVCPSLFVVCCLLFVICRSFV